MRSFILSCACVALLGAQSLGVAGLEFRVVERTGQAVVNGGDNVLDYAVQVRVTGSTTMLYGGGGLTVQLLGEAESRGTLARGAISNSDGTYYAGIGTNVPGTVAGIAASYRYLVGLNPSFNGMINTSVGAVTHDPSIQDIVAISPFPGGAGLIATPGLFGTDINTGDPIPPPGNLVPTAVGDSYSGGNGNFIDIYRFRYTVTELATARTIPVTVALNEQRLFDHLNLVDNIWGAVLGDPLAPSALTVIGTSFTVVPAPGTMLAGGLIGLVALRRRR